jgi:hypothetical protein
VKLGNNKKIVSVRVDSADLDKIKIITDRLRVRDSAFLRFAIKNTLSQLGPLHDPSATGKDLIPMFTDNGSELLRHFEFDRSRLENIINSKLLNDDKMVDSEDIALMAVGELSDSYRYLKLKELSDLPVERQSINESLREYLLRKYLNNHESGDTEL